MSGREVWIDIGNCDLEKFPLNLKTEDFLSETSPKLSLTHDNYTMLDLVMVDNFY